MFTNCYRVVTPTPLCCYMYLAILKRFLLLNFEFTKEIFYIILGCYMWSTDERLMRTENCVPPSDFAVPIVHETLQLLREKVNIGPIEFHEYLLNNNYQVRYLIYCYSFYHEYATNKFFSHQQCCWSKCEKQKNVCSEETKFSLWR